MDKKFLSVAAVAAVATGIGAAFFMKKKEEERNLHQEHIREKMVRKYASSAKKAKEETMTDASVGEPTVTEEDFCDDLLRNAKRDTAAAEAAMEEACNAVVGYPEPPVEAESEMSDFTCSGPEVPVEEHEEPVEDDEAAEDDESEALAKDPAEAFRFVEANDGLFSDDDSLI